MKKNRFFNEWNSHSLMKTFRIMRITVFLLLASILQTFANDAYSQKTKISLDFPGTKLVEVLDKIESKTEFYFLFNEKLIDTDRKVNLSVKNGKIDEILDQLFAGTDVVYTVTDRKIILAPSFLSENEQQQNSVSGTLTNETGQPLPGATVHIKGTIRGTVTDIDGKYSIDNVSADAVLVFSFVGMKTQEVAVSDQKTIDVVLLEESIGLDEVVAIGYGVVKKSDLTGSLTSISNKQFEDQPTTSLSQLLQGRGAGLNITPTSGALGDPSKIRIRGANSISGNNDPLYIVDGFISTVYNIHDVESIEVLKDASATAIYGSRGANGVIIITTKSGRVGQKPTVTITSNTQFGSIPNKYDLLSPAEFARHVNDKYSTNPPFSDNDIAEFESGKRKGVDWQDEIFQTSVHQDYNARIEGGTKKSSFYASLGVTDKKGILVNTKANDYNFSGKFQTEINDRLDIFIKAGLIRGSVLNNGTSTTGRRLKPVYQSLIWAPTTPIYQDDGSYTMNDSYGSINVDVNPVKDVNEAQSEVFNQVGTLNADIKYQLMKDLTVNAMGTFRQTSTESRNFSNSILSRDGADAYRKYTDGMNWQFTTLLNYNKIFAANHNLIATAGYEMLADEAYNFYASGSNLKVESVGSNNLGLASSKSIGSGYTASSLRSYFGRVNYNFKGKYYLTATYRIDGSSKFKGDNRYSHFPSAALTWKASNEDFIKDLDMFDMLKVRASWGVTGNQAISSYQTLARLTSKDYMWGPYSNTRYPGYFPGTLANPDLRWEETTQINIGVDMGFMDNRLGIVLDYFNKITSDLLTPKLVPGYSGNGEGGSILSNLGEVKNTGFEVGINYAPVLRRNFSWEIDLNTYALKNEVLDLGDNSQILGQRWLGGTLTASNTVVGESLGSFYGYTYLGPWKSNEAEEAAKYGRSPGDAKYLDVDNNYEYGEGDLQIIGKNIPGFTWNINNLITYKNFDFNILIAGSHGSKVLNLTYAAAALPEADSNTITLREACENAWSPSNENTMFTSINSNGNFKNSTQWLQDASFIKLRNISVAYRLPKDLIKVGDLKLIVSGQNLFTITDYKGYDPELSSTQGNSDRDSGVDSGIIPPARTFTFGVSFKF